MKFCSQCGQGNQDDSTFCIQCGASLPAEGAAPPPPGAAPPPPGGPVPPPPGAVPPPQAPGAVPPPPMMMPRPAALPNDGMAIASLIMGIAAFLVCPLILGVLAVIFGYMGKRNIEESGGALGGESFAVGGIILGWINIGLTALVILIIIIAAAASHSAMLSSVLPMVGLLAV